MYHYEQKLLAVRRYYDLDHSALAVVRELGYPGVSTLFRWVEEYEKTGGTFENIYGADETCTLEQRLHAVGLYLVLGRNMSETIRRLGYPSRKTLSRWIRLYAPRIGRALSKGATGSDDELPARIFASVIEELDSAQEPAATSLLEEQYRIILHLQQDLARVMRENEDLKAKLAGV